MAAAGKGQEEDAVVEQQQEEEEEDDAMTTSARLKLLMDRVGDLSFTVMQLQSAADRAAVQGGAGGASGAGDDEAAAAARAQLEAELEQRMGDLELRMGSKAEQVGFCRNLGVFGAGWTACLLYFQGAGTSRSCMASAASEFKKATCFLDLVKHCSVSV